MVDRRRLIVLGASSALAAVAGGAGAAPSNSRLQTRLFNFKDDVSADQAADLIANLESAAQAPGLGGFMVGRNLVAQRFPTRFEWIFMIQVDAAAGAAGARAFDRFEAARDLLAAHCLNAVECNLQTPLAPRYANAAGIGVRHTVMFDFKPGTTAEARDRNVEAIRQMGALPMVRGYLVQPSAASVADPIQMQWQVVGDFATVGDYRAYASAPVHLAIRDDFTAHTSRVAFLDVAL